MGAALAPGPSLCVLQARHGAAVKHSHTRNKQEAVHSKNTLSATVPGTDSVQRRLNWHSHYDCGPAHPPGPLFLDEANTVR